MYTIENRCFQPVTAIFCHRKRDVSYARSSAKPAKRRVGCDFEKSVQLFRFSASRRTLNGELKTKSKQMRIRDLLTWDREDHARSVGGVVDAAMFTTGVKIMGIRDSGRVDPFPVVHFARCCCQPVRSLFPARSSAVSTTHSTRSVDRMREH